MLAIPEQAVHDRAHAALAVLAPQPHARAARPSRREEIGDYLLGQQPSVAERLAHANVPERLASRPRVGAGDRRRARPDRRGLAAGAAAGGARGRAGDRARRPGWRPAGGRRDARPRSRRGGGSRPHARPGAPGTPGGARQPSSRAGGAILLAAIVAAIVVAVVLLTGGGSSKHTGTTSTKAAASAKTTGTKTGPAVTARIIMRSPSRRSRAIGAVEILQESGSRAFYIAAENLPATNGFFYAIWLYNSPSSHEPLSRAPAVGSTHRLEGGSLLPSNAGEFSQILLTREHQLPPQQPGAGRAARALHPRGLTSSSLPGFMIPAGSSSAFTARERPHAARADLVAHPGRVVAADGVVVGDGAALQPRSPRSPPA